VFIEREVDAKPPAAQRSLKSIFKPKSAQVLLVLLRDPAREWRVADLSSNRTTRLRQRQRPGMVDRVGGAAHVGLPGVRCSNGQGRRTLPVAEQFQIKKIIAIIENSCCGFALGGLTLMESHPAVG
jgi:hypothetical protein